jgi:hypothetical protein
MELLDTADQYLKQAVKTKRARTRLVVAELDAKTKAVESIEGQKKITDLTLATLDSKIIELENKTDKGLIKNIEILNELDEASRKKFDEIKKSRKTK